MGTKLELSYLPNHRTPRTDAAASPLGPWLSVLDALGCRGGTKASELIAPFAPLFLRPVLYFCALLDIIPNSTITTTSQQIFHLPCSMLFWMQSETLLSPFIGAHGSKRPCANRAAPSTSFPPLWHTRVVTFAHHIHHSNHLVTTWILRNCWVDVWERFGLLMFTSGAFLIHIVGVVIYFNLS